MASSFRSRRVPYPDRAEKKARRPGSDARPLSPLDAPPAIRSAIMRDQLRVALKRAVREMRGDMTQPELAQKIGMHQSALARLESPNNTVFPSPAVLIRVALATGRDLEINFLKRDPRATGPERITTATAGFAAASSAEASAAATTPEEAYGMSARKLGLAGLEEASAPPLKKS